MGTLPQIAAVSPVITPTARDNQHLVNQLKGATAGAAQVSTILPSIHTTYTVSQLNALTGMNKGDTAYVSNGDLTVGWGNAVGATTGAIHLKVHYTGTTWRYG